METWEICGIQRINYVRQRDNRQISGYQISLMRQNERVEGYEVRSVYMSDSSCTNAGLAPKTGVKVYCVRNDYGQYTCFPVKE